MVMPALVTPAMVKTALDEHLQYMVQTTDVTNEYWQDVQIALQGIANHINEALHSPSLEANKLPFVSGTELDVCKDIEFRQQQGIHKYGMTVASNPAHLREWLQHAYEESLDKAIYLKRAIAELDSQPTEKS